MGHGRDTARWNESSTGIGPHPALSPSGLGERGTAGTGHICASWDKFANDNLSQFKVFCKNDLGEATGGMGTLSR